MTGNEFFEGFRSHFPEVLALLTFLLGAILAYLLRKAVKSGVPFINKLSLRWGSHSGSLLSPGFARFLQAIVFWGVLMGSVILGLLLLSGGETSTWLDGLWVIVAQILVALGILAAGHILGLLAQSLLSGLSDSSDLDAFSRLAYGVIVGIAIVTALKNLGLDVSFITQVLLVVITVFFAGLALAFALGARTLAANLSAQSDMRRFQPGDHLMVDGIEGTILEIHRTGAVLTTTEGMANVPAAKFAESTIIKLRREPEDDG